MAKSNGVTGKRVNLLPSQAAIFRALFEQKRFVEQQMDFAMQCTGIQGCNILSGELADGEPHLVIEETSEIITE
tara:strand:- start:227 stop:448 length:222 start_codon:yes stop_codon:yes gene_type:complete